MRKVTRTIVGWLFPRIFGKLKHISSCANRTEWTYKKDEFEYRIIRRDTSHLDMYSREEIYLMYVLILKEGARTGWYPWPKTDEERGYDIRRMNETAGVEPE